MKNTEIREFIAQLAHGSSLGLAEQKRILETLLRANNRIILYRKEFGELPADRKLTRPHLAAVPRR